DESVEDSDGCGERLDLVVLERGDLLVQQRAVLGANTLERLAAGVGDRNDDGASVLRIGLTIDPASMLEPVDQLRDAGLRDALARGELGDAVRARRQGREHADLGAREAGGRPREEDPRERRRALGKRSRELVELSRSPGRRDFHNSVILADNGTERAVA